MTPDEVFEYAVEVVLREEGGYVNDPRDPGGETNWGISKRAYPQLDIKRLTREEAKAIYKRDYWGRIGAASMPPALAVVALDCAVNHGVARTLSWLSERRHTAASLTARRLLFFSDLSTWPTFGRGWARRAARVLEAAETVA